MLQVDGLGKNYKLYPNQRARLRELVFGTRNHEVFRALQDVSFRLGPGDTLGVIGDNGAGKSTLLKLIAGTLRPSAGQVRVEGRLTAILALGTGFHPEFTGRENLFFAASLMGIERQEMLGYYDDIVDFSELHRVMDRPVKTYSTGMLMRLAFSLVTAVNPEILIVDEALAVGDRAFQRRCIARMQEIRRAGTTILFCSHSMHHIVQFCDRALWLEHGRMKDLDAASKVTAAYTGKDVPIGLGGRAPAAAPAEGRRRCVVDAVELLSGSRLIRRGEPLRIGLDFRVLEAGPFVFGLAVDHKDAQVRLIAETSLENGVAARHIAEGSHRLELCLHTQALREGVYAVFAGLMDESLLQIEDYRALDVEVVDPDAVRTPAMVRARVDWDTAGRFSA
jgi:ABC-type polysaccharide/polyol phosphate transport system ATPase subunit